MRVNILPNTLMFEGVLDESTAPAELVEAFQKVRSSDANAPVSLDLSKVERANSSGILTWLKFIRAAGCQFKYVNAPVWLVNQFNMISGYFEGGSFVESFQAPYFSSKTQTSRNFKLTLGKDLPVQPEYNDQQVPNRVVNGEEFEVDFEPEDYFQFIAQNYESFRKNSR